MIVTVDDQSRCRDDRQPSERLSPPRYCPVNVLSQLITMVSPVLRSRCPSSLGGSGSSQTKGRIRLRNTDILTRIPSHLAPYSGTK